jgi:hypothetical protein
LDVLLYKSRSYDLEALRHPSLNRWNSHKH